MIHVHVSAWSLALIFLFVSYFLYKNGNVKKAKIFHMINRVLYIVIIGTGGYMLTGFLKDPSIVNKGPLIVKGILGLVVVSLMEMILVKQKKNELRAMYWVLFFIALLLVFYYGYVVLR